MSAFNAKIGASLLTCAVLAACGGGDSASTPVATTQDVSIDFAATVGATVLGTTGCANTAISGVASRKDAAGNTVAVNARLTDLRFYIANLKLVKADGTTVPVTLDESAWQANAGSDSVALLDFEDGTCVNNAGSTVTNTRITGKAASGTYTGVAFTLGVPESLNHTDPVATTTPKPLNADQSALAWSWQSGRKFMKIELSPENATTAGTYTGGVQAITAAGIQATTTAADGTVTNVANTSTFVYHLGNTGCVADAAATSTGGYTCSAKNQTDITIAALDPSTQRVSFDLQALFAGNNATQNTQGTAAGCMSSPTDPQCPAMFSMLTAAKAGTTVFRAISK